MAQADPPLLRQLQAFLLLAEPDDDATFLRHVAKVLGVVLRHYQDQDLKASLEALVEVEGAGDEASMELGLFSMEVGLVALDRHIAGASFRSALGWFRRSMQQSEERPDAKLYGLCAEVLVTVQEKGLHHDVSGFVDRLRHAAFEYSAYLMPEHPVFTGSWLEFSSLERFQWLSLCTKLGALSLSLAREEYLHAASVIEDELLPIFKAGHRIFDRDAGFFRIFISGDRSMYNLVDTVKVLRDSKKALVELRPFAFREQEQQTDFAKFLKAFDKDMPFLSTPLLNKQLEEAFFFATRGRPGTLAIFLETAADFAFRRMNEKGKKSAEVPKTIELVDLIKAFDQMMAGETRMLGINPFTHSGALPSYAKTLDEELEELQRAILRGKPRGPNRGGRLQD